MNSRRFWRLLSDETSHAFSGADSTLNWCCLNNETVFHIEIQEISACNKMRQYVAQCGLSLFKLHVLLRYCFKIRYNG